MRKNLISKALILVAAVFALTSSKPVRVACIGDSITYGAGIKDREADSYPVVLQRMLGDGYEVRNFGFNARIMQTVGDHPYMSEKMYTEVKEFLPDIVTIMLGTNDTKPHNWRSDELFYQDYLKMVDELSALDSHPRIYLCNSPWVAIDKWGINDSTVVAGVMPQIRAVANKRWMQVAEVIDTYATLNGQPDKYVDGVHPNEAGAAMLSQTIFEAFGRNGDTGRVGKRILFIGDSITDGDWGLRNAKPCSERNHYDRNHVYGHGYQEFCASWYQSRYPERGYKFYNRGISGDRLYPMSERWDRDVFPVHPDIVSIYIGINDVLSGLADFQAWEQKYRELLDRTIAYDPQIRLVLCTPFIGKVGVLGLRDNFDEMQRSVGEIGAIIRKIAADYGAVLVPFDELYAGLNRKGKASDIHYWSWDGVHPTSAMHMEMSRLWESRAKKLMK